MYTRVFSGSTQRSLWRCQRSNSSGPGSANQQPWSRISARAGASGAHRGAWSGFPTMVSAPDYDLELAELETEDLLLPWETSRLATASNSLPRFAHHAGHHEGRLPATRARPRAKGINLGYTCDNITLKRERGIYTSRSCIKKTFETKGLEHVSGLALANCLNLLDLIEWNYQRGIHLYRMTSKLFPWAGHYELRDLPDYPVIEDALSAVGQLARASDQRITNHPSCYIKLAATNEELIGQSVRDLEVQSRIFDMMGYEPSHVNKINIHVGGVYGNKQRAMDRFAKTFHGLSPGLRSRLTVENDDSANSYAVDDLLVLHEMTGIPITFDFHHYQFCPGAMTKKEALEAAMGTWPRGIRPVVHWSEMPECPTRRKSHPHSHSNFVYGPLDLFGYEEDVDVMIESKAKEAALLLLRERL